MEFQSATLGELAKALSAAQGKITFALKDCTADMGVKGGKRKYADLQAVIDAVKPALAENNLAYAQAVMPATDGIALRTTLMHSSGEWIAGEIRLPNDRMGGIQGMGSALTYARRYALSAMVGVAPDEDDDGQAAQDAWKDKQTQRPAAQKSAQESAQKTAQKTAQKHETTPQMSDELKAKAMEVWNALGAAGFQSPADRIHEIGRRLGKSIQRSSELTLDDCEAVLWSLKNSEQPSETENDNPF